MMDLLFGMFGALVVLTVIISFKLGASTGVDQRPFHSVVVELTALNNDIGLAFERMHLGFILSTPSEGQDVSDSPTCTFAASNYSTPCLTDFTSANQRLHLAEFATSVSHAEDGSLAVLRASLLINEPSDITELPRIIVRPVLRDIAALFDVPQIDTMSAVSVRLSVKTGIGVLEPKPFKLTVEQLIARAEKSPRIGADLLADTQKLCPAVEEATTVNCEESRLYLEGGYLEFLW